MALNVFLPNRIASWLCCYWFTDLRCNVVHENIIEGEQVIFVNFNMLKCSQELKKKKINWKKLSFFRCKNVCKNFIKRKQVVLFILRCRNYYNNWKGEIMFILSFLIKVQKFLWEIYEKKAGCILLILRCRNNDKNDITNVIFVISKVQKHLREL